MPLVKAVAQVDMFVSSGPAMPDVRPVLVVAVKPTVPPVLGAVVADRAGVKMAKRGQYEFSFVPSACVREALGGVMTARGAIRAFAGSCVGRYENWLAFVAPLNWGAL